MFALVARNIGEALYLIKDCYGPGRTTKGGWNIPSRIRPWVREFCGSEEGIEGNLPDIVDQIKNRGPIFVAAKSPTAALGTLHRVPGNDSVTIENYGFFARIEKETIGVETQRKIREGLLAVGE